MIFIIPLAFYFIASVSCLPFFSSYKRFFNTECASLIQHDLDLSQGMEPDVTNPANFGYIYRLNTPTINVGPDMAIKHTSTENTEALPSQAAVILSSFTFDESLSKLIVRGRISKLNADRLQRVSAQEGSEMKLQFNIFGLDDAYHWHSKLGTTGDITGTVNSMNVIQQKNGEETFQELIMKLTPVQDSDSVEYIEYNDTPSSMKQLVWGLSAAKKNPCRTSKRDRFHEIIDSAVLL